MGREAALLPAISAGGGLAADGPDTGANASREGTKRRTKNEQTIRVSKASNEKRILRIAIVVDRKTSLRPVSTARKDKGARRRPCVEPVKRTGQASWAVIFCSSAFNAAGVRSPKPLK